jgi:predicted NBD/HSP70 family sugar kinase
LRFTTREAFRKLHVETELRWVCARELPYARERRRMPRVAAQGSDHRLFTALLNRMSQQAAVGSDVFGRVLARVLVASPGAVTQQDIATGVMLQSPSRMTPSTVSRAVRQLLDHGLLSPQVVTDPQGTRGRVGVGLDGARWSLIGVHLAYESDGISSMLAVATNLQREVRHESAQAVAGAAPPDVMVDGIVALVAELAAQEVQQGRMVLGVGLEVGAHVRDGDIKPHRPGGWAIAGLARRLTGRLTFALPEGPLAAVAAVRDALGDEIQREGIDVGTAAIAEGLPLPVALENDVNARALRLAYSSDVRVRNAAVVAVFDEGVGGALIRNGRLNRGERGAAGELGHLTVDFDADKHHAKGQGFLARCSCGQLGHVENYATPLRMKAESRRVTGRQSAPPDFATLSQQLAVDRSGVPTKVGEVFDQAGGSLGRGIGQLVTATDPGRVILLLPEPLLHPGGGTTGEIFRRAIKRELLKHAFGTDPTGVPDDEDPFDVISTDTPEEFARQGAIAAAVCVLDALVEHARGRDDCDAPTRGRARASSVPGKT